MEFVHLQVGDLILEVNGISFFSIVHSDAANALRYVCRTDNVCEGTLLQAVR